MAAFKIPNLAGISSTLIGRVPFKKGGQMYVYIFSQDGRLLEESFQNEPEDESFIKREIQDKFGQQTKVVITENRCDLEQEKKDSL